MDADRARRLALNEAVARDVNPAVEETGRDWHDAGERIELICECSAGNCSARIHVTRAEYEQVRENDLRFMLVDGHVNEEIEHRVGTVGDATIVEKEGPGRSVASSTAG